MPTPEVNPVEAQLRSVVEGIDRVFAMAAARNPNSEAEDRAEEEQEREEERFDSGELDEDFGAWFRRQSDVCSKCLRRAYLAHRLGDESP
jgi:hypothetical protein